MKKWFPKLDVVHGQIQKKLTLFIRKPGNVHPQIHVLKSLNGCLVGNVHCEIDIFRLHKNW